MRSYDYAHRRGVRRIAWGDFGKLAAHLAQQLAGYQPQVIIGIARGGLFPATAVACMLRNELFPVRLTRRVNDVAVHETPIWKVPVPAEVAGKVVAVVDDIADTGKTLALAAGEVSAMGAKQVVTAALVCHSWATPPPDVVAWLSDALIIFPWDEEVLMNGQWQLHPEYEAAIKA